MGARARQGPHHVAQKSTSTGVSDFKTSWSKFASVTSTIPLPAILFLSSLQRRAVGRRSHRACVAGSGDLRIKAYPIKGTNYYRTGLMPGGRRRSQKGGGERFRHQAGKEITRQVSSEFGVPLPSA